MAKNIKKTKLTKIPTSELIFYMTYPELCTRNSKDIENTVYDRLTKQYNLQPNNALDFVDSEQAKIEARGNILANYFFGDGKKEDILKIFFESFSLIMFNVYSNKPLTMSEMLNYCDYFFIQEELYKKRLNKYEYLIYKYKLKLNNADYYSSFIEKKSIINNLDKKIENFSSSIKKEKELIAVYDRLTKLLYNNSRESICCSDFSSIAYKESLLLSQKTPLIAQDLKQGKNINFDAYSRDLDIIEQYSHIHDFTFSRKK